MAGYGVTITAVDRYTKVLDGFNKKLEQQQRPIARLQQSMARLADNTGVTKVAEGFAAMEQTAKRAFSAVDKIAAPIAAIGSLASVAGLARAGLAWGEYGRQLSRTAQRAGLSTKALQDLEGGARLAGVSAGVASSGFIAFRDGLVDSAVGRNPAFLGMIHALIPEFDTLNKSQRTATALLPRLAERFSHMRDPTLQAEAATALFGAAGEQLLPYLREGAAGIARLSAESQKYGTLTDDQIKDANSLADAQSALTLQLERTGLEIAAKLAPSITPLLTDMSKWIDANKGWIATDLPNEIKSAAKQVGEFIDKVDNITKSFDRWKLAAEAAGAAILLGPVASVASLTAKLTKFGAITLPSWAIRLLGLGPATVAAATVGLSGDTIPDVLPGGLGVGDMTGLNLRRIGSWGGYAVDEHHRPLARMPGAARWDGKTPGGAPAVPQEIDAVIRNAARAYGVPASLLAGLFRHESNFDPNAFNAAGGGHGASGLGQLRDSSGTTLPPSARFDPAANANESARLLAQLFKRYGNWHDALKAYAAGGDPESQRRNNAEGTATDIERFGRPYEGQYGDHVDGSPVQAAPQIGGGAGASPPAAPAPAAPSGHASIGVHITGRTDLAQVTARAGGDLWADAPRVTRAMPGAALA